MTSAQIELMMYDVVITIYHTDKGDKFGKVSEKKVSDTVNEWKEKYSGAESKKIKLGELMSGMKHKQKEG